MVSHIQLIIVIVFNLWESIFGLYFKTRLLPVMNCFVIFLKRELIFCELIYCTRLKWKSIKRSLSDYTYMSFSEEQWSPVLCCISSRASTVTVQTSLFKQLYVSLVEVYSIHSSGNIAVLIRLQLRWLVIVHLHHRFS